MVYCSSFYALDASLFVSSSLLLDWFPMLLIAWIFFVSWCFLHVLTGTMAKCLSLVIVVTIIWKQNSWSCFGLVVEGFFFLIFSGIKEEHLFFNGVPPVGKALTKSYRSTLKVTHTLNVRLKSPSLWWNMYFQSKVCVFGLLSRNSSTFTFESNKNLYPSELLFSILHVTLQVHYNR